MAIKGCYSNQQSWTSIAARHVVVVLLVLLACLVPPSSSRHTTHIRHLASERRPRIYMYHLPEAMTKECWPVHDGSHKWVSTAASSTLPH